ncbi:MAG: pyruvate, phosphate dikinase [Chlamydiales bacterium]|nr:pyruvate, phosphate dikinase [Chlamydiales bacterium]
MTGAETPTQPEPPVAYIFPFGEGLRLPPLERKLLGAKGQHLAEMSSLGLPVPPGFVITSDACHYYFQNNKQLPPGLQNQIQAALKVLESQMKLQFGDEEQPLLVSIRAGASISMPGMMDTVLNLGLNDKTVVGFAKAMNNERLAYDCYRRFIAMYATIVHDVPRELFANALQEVIKAANVEDEADLSVDALKGLCKTLQNLFGQQKNIGFPQDTQEQLKNAIIAVLESWDSERCRLYRQINHIPDDLGTAVTIQAMVFGNRNDLSATGVAFTRDPSTGENVLYGEFLPNAQGEDVVAGVRVPQPINQQQKQHICSTLESLEQLQPEIYQQLYDVAKKLEKHYRDMQDIEFTIDNGRLFMLQTRSGKRTGLAAARMAVEMLEEGLIDEVSALRKIQPEQIEQLIAPVFHPSDKECARCRHMATGLSASPGAASGRIALSPDKAIEFQRDGIAAILIREETSPEDYSGMVVAEGILTARGGITSHAAVVARSMGKPCIVGCGVLKIDYEQGTVATGEHTLKEGDSISIDGTTGEVFACALESSPSEILQVILTKERSPESSQLYRYYDRIMTLADKYRRMQVRANTDTPHDATIALAFGAEGIGLCRTEYMFFDERRLTDARRALFSPTLEEREAAVQQLLPYQKDDFKRIFRTMNGLPVTIRLLDPPLNEFLPENEEALKNLAQSLNIPEDVLLHRAKSLEENNPMLGYRGCRLGVLNPALTRMQAVAIFEAAVEVMIEGGRITLEIMVPLVGIKNELTHQKLIIDSVAKEVSARHGLCPLYTVGTMIELPRAALIAGSIAEEAEFFSFGTNDLTQTTFGMSRDDSARFIPRYVHGVPNPTGDGEEMRILPDDPFQTLDVEGVLKLMQIAIEEGRKTRPSLKCGICGEHGGDPRSIILSYQIGVNYVSCSPYRLPIARLAAAHASIEHFH